MSYRLILGDAIEVLATFEPDLVDLTVTSPPYDKLRTHECPDISQLSSELHRVTRPGGVVVWVVADATENGSETGSSFRHALTFIEVGFRLHDTMIYHKDNPPPVGGPTRYYQAWEYMFVFSKGAPRVFNPITRPQRNKWNDPRTSRVRAVSRGRDGEFGAKRTVPIRPVVKRSNVWRYVVSGGSIASDPFAHRHPAVFPESLARDHIVSWSDPGDLVLDPMMGSGTTVKVAHALRREAIGIEVSEEYLTLAKERVETPFVPRDSHG